MYNEMCMQIMSDAAKDLEICVGVRTHSIDWADATRGVAGSLGGLLAKLRCPIVSVAGGLCVFPARRVPGAVVKNACRLKHRGPGLLGR